MDYILSEPIQLSNDPLIKEQTLAKYAPLIAKAYKEPFDPNNPGKQINASKDASHIVLAHDTQGEPVGLLTYRVRHPESPSSSGFYGRLDLDKLPVHLYPNFLSEESRERVAKYLQKLRYKAYGIEFSEKAVIPELGSNGVARKLSETAIAPFGNEKLFILGNAQPATSVLSRERIFSGNESQARATVWGGEVLRPDLMLPGGLTPQELQVLALVFAHSFAKEHYPEALDIAAGENFDLNALLNTGDWPKHLEPTDFSYAATNLAAPQAQKVEQKILKRQQETGKPISGIVTTILDKPNPALQKAA